MELSVTDETVVQVEDDRLVVGEYSASVEEVFGNGAHVDEILPHNCIYYGEYGARYGSGPSSVIVLEESPRMRLIHAQYSCDHDRRGDQRKVGKYRDFCLAVPYVYHILWFSGKIFQQSSVFFRHEKLSSFQDYLVPAYLLNVDTRGRVCLGRSSGDVVQEAVGIFAKANRYIGTFWGAKFNFDMPSSAYDYAPAPFNNFAAWETCSQENPNFVLEKPFEIDKSRSTYGGIPTLLSESGRMGASTNDTTARFKQCIKDAVIRAKTLGLLESAKPKSEEKPTDEVKIRSGFTTFSDFDPCDQTW